MLSAIQLYKEKMIIIPAQRNLNTDLIFMKTFDSHRLLSIFKSKQQIKGREFKEKTNFVKEYHNLLNGENCKE